jgi:hypothetical protein
VDKNGRDYMLIFRILQEENHGTLARPQKRADASVGPLGQRAA